MRAVHTIYFYIFIVLIHYFLFKSVVKVFKLPSSDESREGLLCDSSADLRGHQRRITTARVCFYFNSKFLFFVYIFSNKNEQ